MELAGNTGRGLSRDERTRSLEPGPESRSSGSEVEYNLAFLATGIWGTQIRSFGAARPPADV
jgi:hypothetical protein